MSLRSSVLRKRRTKHDAQGVLLRSHRSDEENRAAALIILAAPHVYDPDSGLAIWARAVLRRLNDQQKEVPTKPGNSQPRLFDEVRP